MSSGAPSSTPPDPTNQPTYVWSRIDPRINRLIRDKLRKASLVMRKEVERETEQIHLENRLNSNKRGVDLQIVRMWAGKIQAHAEMCYEKIFVHHWSLLGHTKTGAFVRACSAILGRHIDRLGSARAHQARMEHRRSGCIRPSLEARYKSSAAGVRKELEELWDIEARELELAASPAGSREHAGSRPPDRRNAPTASSGVDPLPKMRPREIVVEGGPLLSTDADATVAAVEMLQKLGFNLEERGWPSPNFGPVLSEVLTELKQAHRILTTKGFRVIGDPLNPIGDGRSWVLRFRPTDQMPKDANFAELSERYLQSEGVKVAATPVQDGLTFLVALWDSGRGPVAQHRNKREDFVRPLLESRGWSILDWAKNSGVDFHTANDYLKGKTGPFSSTRKKLADSLRIDAKDLPG